MRKLITLSAGLLVGCAPAGPPVTHAGPPEDQPHLVLQVGPRDSVTAVAFSPDGQLVASGSFDGKARIYDRRTGALLRAIGSEPCRGLNALAFSPDGKRLACGGLEMDKTVKVWDPRTGALVRTLAGHATADAGNLYAEVYALAFSPDGKRLASAGRDKVALVWDLETGVLLHRLAGHEDVVASVAFAPDGKTVASGGADRVIRLWDATTGRSLRTLRGHRDRVNTVAFSPDGKTLASGSSDRARTRGSDPSRAGEVRLWGVATGEVVRSLPERGRIHSLAFAPDGKSLACVVGRGVRLYEVKTGQADGVVATHEDEVTSVAFAPDGSAIASGSHDRTVAVTALPERTARLKLPGSWEQVNSVALAPDGALIAAGSSDIRFAEGRLKPDAPGIGSGGVRLWDARTGEFVRRLGGTADQVSSVAFAPDGRWVASGGGGADGAGIVRLWDGKAGAQLWAQADHRGAVLSVAFAPDGKALASAGADGALKLRDVTTGAVRETLTGHEGAVTSVAFSADGTTLASGGADQTARLWDARTGRPGRVLRAEAFKPGESPRKKEGLITSVALSPDGATLATCSSSETPGYGDRLVRLWDTRTGALKHTLERSQSRGRVVAFAPDGTTLASSGTGKSFALWDVRTGKLLREFPGHPHPAQAAVFTPDGRGLVSGGDYQEVRLWDAGSGRLRATLMTFAESKDRPAPDDWLAITPDGPYDGSPGVDRLLAWRVGRELLTADRLEPPRRRPDLLRESLRGRR